MTCCEGCTVPSRVEDLVPVILDPDLPTIPCHTGSIIPRHGDDVVVELTDGVFLGKVSLFASPVVRKPPRGTDGKIVRTALEEDIRRADELRAHERRALTYLRRRVRELGLEMRPLKVRFTLEGRKAVVFFMAEHRVEYSGLVRDAARRYRRRIEMRHLGVRDGAKVVGGLGPCGRALCCSGFMSRFHSVTVRMAKRQNLSLNPAKISGMCGRLMCCLAHEADQYPELKKRRG